MSLIKAQERAKELAILFRLALPTMITQLLRYVNPSISIMVCGHLSREELDAASLASTVINVLGLSIDTGFSSAYDTLFSQAYGSKEKNMLRLFLQRAVFLSMLLYSVLVCFHLNIEPLLLKLGQDPLIASLTSEYLTAFLPGLACDFLFLTFARYLQSQCIVLPMLFASLTGTLFNLLAQYHFIVQLRMGLWASAFCLSCAFGCMLLVELTYLVFIRGEVDIFNTFASNPIFSNWGIIFRLGIPGLFMVALEEWCFEMMTLVAGTIDKVNLGAQAITFQIQSIIYMLPLGIFTAVNIRVGQNLGAFNPHGARLSYTTALMVIPLVCLFTGIPVLLLRDRLPELFTTDRDICQLTSTILPMLVYFQICEGFSGVSEAVLLACGRQNLGACIIFVGYYCIGTPIATLLVYNTSLGIMGAWIGLAIGFGITTLVYTWFAVRTRWTDEARQAHNNVYEYKPDVEHLPVQENEIRFSENIHETCQPANQSILLRLPGSWKRTLLILALVSIWSSGIYFWVSRREPFWKQHCWKYAHMNQSSTNTSEYIDPEASTFCSRMLRKPAYLTSQVESLHVEALDRYNYN